MSWSAIWVLLSPFLSAGIVFAFLKWAGNTWMGRLLNRDLEAFKREQQEKIETLKAEQHKS